MKNKKIAMSRYLCFLLILSLAINTTTKSQSTNQSSPTSLTITEFTGEGPNKETNYYFSFTGGPGEVSVTLKIKATDYSTFARLEILTSGFSTLATHNMNATTGTGPQEVTKKIVLKKQQKVILKLTLDSNLDEYTVTLGGAVKIDTPSEDNSSQVSENNNSDQGKQQVSIGQSTEMYKYGAVMNLPKSGTMIIKMKDGTTQKIDLKKVQSVTVNKL